MIPKGKSFKEGNEFMSHDHQHPHSHSHEHHSSEETLALLTYMLGHNRHHAEELHELAHGISEEAAALLHEAVKDYEAGNEKLGKALELMKENV